MARREGDDRHAHDRQYPSGPIRANAVYPGETLNDMGGGYMNDFYAREFWRFVLVQHAVGALGQTAIEYPAMQAPATFNLEAVKRQIDELIKEHEGQ
jgi:arylsulfatase